MSEINENELQKTTNVSLNLRHNNDAIFTRLLLWISVKRWFVLALLFFMLIIYGVFVYLPSTIDKNAIKVDKQAVLQQQNAKPIDESPFHQAQLAKQRKESQAILQQIVELQNQLEQTHVKSWAATEYQTALKTASAGDLHYREQQFDQAKAQYNQSLALLTEIKNQIPRQYKQFMADGNQALAENNADKAVQNFQMALHLQPDSTSAAELLHRASVLNDLLSLIKQGDIAVEENNWQSAKKFYQQAYNLDTKSTLAKQKLNEAQAQIRENRYASLMSQGFIQLKKQSFQPAIQFFRQASKVSVKNNQAAQAIEQAKNEQTQFNITELLSSAQQKQQQELWQQAKQDYQAILKIDASIVEARVGEIQASVRAKLDENLQHIINNPMRLTNANVFAKAQQVLQQAKQIKNGGARLNGQIAQIESLFKKLSQPILVTINSDNATQVRIFKFGDLGQFQQKQINLKPGEYTLLGTRNGYQDVQKHLVIKPSSSNQRISIICQVKV